MRINSFERNVREQLKQLNSEHKVYLKKNYAYEIFNKHAISDEEVDFLFDMKRVIQISPNIAFPHERIDAEINSGKNRKIKIIFTFDPVVKGEKLKGKVGIITAFSL